MELTDTEIVEYIKNPRAAAELSAALHLQNHHKLHVNGEKHLYHDWLEERGKDLETVRTINRKKEFCKPKSPRIYDQVKKQFFKIFRAKGTVKTYKFKGDSDDNKKELIEYLNNVSYGLSMEQFMQVLWFSAMFDEFNGFVGVELKPEDELKEQGKPEPYCVLYPLHIIHDVYIRGNDVEYIIIKKEIVVDNEVKEAYRIIDSKRDVIFYKSKKQTGEDEYVKLTKLNDKGEVVPDEYQVLFKKVPFAQISRYRLRTDWNVVKASPITKSLADADSFLSVSSDHDVSVKTHGNPIFYSFPVMCATCNGTGSVRKSLEGGEIENNQCGTCNGNKMVNFLKTDVLQGISLPVAEEYENAGFPAAPTPCGYVTIDTETLEQQRTELDRDETAVEKSTLGVSGMLQRSSGQQTLGGQELDLQPLMDTLSSFSGNGEWIEQFLVTRMAEVRYKNFESAFIRYGRKYFLRNEQSVLKEFKEAKEAGANDSFLRELTEELYYTRFENNPKALERALILLDVEPLPMRNHVEELEQMKFSISEDTLKLKYNFNDLVEKFERENGPITEFKKTEDENIKQYYSRVEQIQTKLYEYVKQIKTPTPDSGGTGQQPQA